MNKKIIVYHFIVDESESMIDCEDIIINAINEQINKLKNIESKSIDEGILFGLTTFNDKIKHHYIKTKPSIIQLLKSDFFELNGSTALLDAVGQTIQLIENEVRINKAGLSTKIEIVILTDGYDNVSKIFTLDGLRDLISRLEESGEWTFNFIGAAIDAIEVSTEFLINAHNNFNFEK
jgi:hypothetical protein